MKMEKWLPVVWILAIGLARGSWSQPIVLQGETMRLEAESHPFVLRILDQRGREMLATDGPLAFTQATGQNTFRFVLWWFWNRGLLQPWSKVDQVVSVARSGNSLLVDLGHQAEGPALVRMKAAFLDARTLRVEMEVLERPEVNRFRIAFRKDAADRYYGLGERFNAVEHSGERVRVWSEEGGLGLFHLSQIWPHAPFNPFPKGEDTTYYPVPFFLNPAKGYGFLLDDVRYSEFDFGKSRRPRTVIENWNRRFNFLVFYGPSPLEVIEAQTAYTGRITVPPAWVFAPMNAVVTGEARVREVAELLRREKIPTSAIWSESWWWRNEWQVNRKLFPHYEQLIADLHADGFRHLGYYQPYIGVRAEAYREGDTGGYFTKNRQGQSYAFGMGRGVKAQVDLTNPAAREWWKQSFFQMSEQMGEDGWMHDFGEHTPPDSVSFDGRSGWEVHNEYPLLWAQLGKEFWDRARPDGDYCFYVRGGYTGTQRYASVMWTGDQNTNFERLDGLPSNLPGLMSVGISGHPLGTTDIAGYNCFVSRSTDQELFMRWAEFGALLPVMRIHRGDDEICHNWSFDQNPETLEHYKRYAILHTALFPYLYTLVHEAARRGWPVVRHLSLHYPDDPETWRLDYQYLLGDRVLVAPVLKRGAREWEVYFPAGEWAHWWTGRIYRGPGRATVPAKMGEIPMFVAAGKILPLFDSQIDTLVQEDRPDLHGWDDANSSVQVIFYGTGQDQYALWDGTLIRCERAESSAPGACSIENAPVQRSYTYDFR